ncbi:hypothetical protein SAMN05192563_10215 [Paraburkholderia aspalathi]|uniref:Uncharacterized protein n=1 Tax=Paraburkholderia aspalathi TaxID=1324617 RepID=A0A1I7EHN2_9BURK|nr:hypothetical protein SAMN05192563_10215 [Paraburkholderia aspalathi]
MPCALKARQQARLLSGVTIAGELGARFAIEQVIFVAALRLSTDNEIVIGKKYLERQTRVCARRQSMRGKRASLTFSMVWRAHTRFGWTGNVSLEALSRCRGHTRGTLTGPHVIP